jgi:hypothetical protein
MHVLFHWENPMDIPRIISDDALKAAISFVDLSIQHTAYLAGRGDITETTESIHQMQQGEE